MDAELKKYLEKMQTDLAGKIDRAAVATASDIGSLHTEIQQVETRLKTRIDDMDRRLRRVDANTITTLELLTRQSRWHEESDNAIQDMLAAKAEMERKLDELRARIEKLEKAS